MRPPMEDLSAPAGVLAGCSGLRIGVGAPCCCCCFAPCQGLLPASEPDCVLPKPRGAGRGVLASASHRTGLGGTPVLGAGEGVKPANGTGGGGGAACCGVMLGTWMPGTGAAAAEGRAAPNSARVLGGEPPREGGGRCTGNSI